MDPVTDWTTDFDIADLGYQNDPYPIWDELREVCPVAHSDRQASRTILPTRYDDIAAVAYDTDHFSSRDVGTTPPVPGSTTLVAPPITSDPPFHTAARRILLPHFSPAATEKLQPETEAICTRLLDGIEAAGRAGAVVDAAEAYAQHIPVRVIGHMLGIPESDVPTFLDWAVKVFQSADNAVIRTATKEILAYFGEQVAMRRQERSDDLISALIDADLDGSPLTDKHILGTCFLLLMAGIDTTWSSIGAAIWHLGTHPEDRDRLVADPALLPMAIEEFLRAYAPVTMARIATEETEIGGCPVHPGDRVLLPFPSGNRDPDKFDDPAEVIIDRERNRHFAFGIGIHRCLGSNLARMEMQVAIGLWLQRFPSFTLAPDTEVRWGGTQVRGPRELPVVLGL